MRAAFGADFGWNSRQSRAEHRAVLVRGLRHDGAAVHRDDFAGDVEPEPQACGRAVFLVRDARRNLHQRIEYHLQLVRGNPAPVVLHLDRYLVRFAARGERYRLAPRAVTHRVAQEVREHLLKAFAVEPALQIARGLEAENPFRVRGPYFVQVDPGRYTQTDLNRWILGRQIPPHEVFLRALDLAFKATSPVGSALPAKEENPQPLQRK